MHRMVMRLCLLCIILASGVLACRGTSEPIRVTALSEAADARPAAVPVTSKCGNGLSVDCDLSPAKPQPKRGPSNVEGNPLETCSTSPMTGWFRDGTCRTDANDQGLHVVCAQVTERFLAFTASRGNDLSTPAPRYRFPGLKPGDRWCLCAVRWAEALRGGAAPAVVLNATHSKALSIVPAETLRANAVSMDP